MAYDDSEALQPNSTYNLGGYSFELKVQTVHEPGEPDVVSVYAICRSPDGTRETVPADYPEGAKVESWNVEANETEASVYISGKLKPIVNPTFTTPADDSSKVYTMVGETFSFIEVSNGFTVNGNLSDRTATLIESSAKVFATLVNAERTGYDEVFLASTEPFTMQLKDGSHVIATYTDRRQHVQAIRGKNDFIALQSYNIYLAGEGAVGDDMCKFGNGNRFDDATDLIARFAIDLREADGGPDGDWDEPGDVGPDPENYYTLTVSVTGASSGSNSGTPLEPGQAGGYGNGGTGGNGGGGGAGASTVIIYEFATNKADNVVQEATAQGPGSGGPGGKGGKGGDGCILIFY